MKAAVVYESMYGNTHRIAQAIAEGLATATEVVSVYAVGRIDFSGLDLLVVGDPRTKTVIDVRGSTRQNTTQRSTRRARAQKAACFSGAFRTLEGSSESSMHGRLSEDLFGLILDAFDAHDRGPSPVPEGSFLLLGCNGLGASCSLGSSGFHDAPRSEAGQ